MADFLLGPIYYNGTQTSGAKTGLTVPTLNPPTKGVPTPQPDDVLSLQADGKTWQRRPKGSINDFENCAVVGGVVIFRPNPNQKYSKDVPDAYYPFAAFDTSKL